MGEQVSNSERKHRALMTELIAKDILTGHILDRSLEEEIKARIWRSVEQKMLRGSVTPEEAEVFSHSVAKVVNVLHVLDPEREYRNEAGERTDVPSRPALSRLEQLSLGPDGRLGTTFVDNMLQAVADNHELFAGNMFPPTADYLLGAAEMLVTQGSQQ